MKNPAIERWIQNHLDQHPARANSLIITVYGDFIAPHGGTVWLGSLIRLVDALGLNERVVRTSVYRLSLENWLQAEQRGRRSYYSLTHAGRRRFESAWRRIYFGPDERWSGEWQLVVLPASLNGGRRDALRKELLWAGFGALAGGVFAHPSPDEHALLDILQQTGTRDSVVTMKAHHIGPPDSRPLQQVVHDCWNLDVLSARYRAFTDTFKPVLRALRKARTLDPEQCFLVQTLLMHGFRRTLLHDPQLPAQMLPADWAGGIARDLCQALYRITFEHAQAHLLAICETTNGSLPAAAPTFYERFGGLETTNDSAGSKRGVEERSATRGTSSAPLNRHPIIRGRK